MNATPGQSGTPFYFSQDSYNKLITLLMLLFWMAMYIWSFATGRDLNLTGIIGFLVPMLTHTTHLISNVVNNNTAVKAASSPNVTPQSISDTKGALSST